MLLIEKIMRVKKDPKSQVSIIHNGCLVEIMERLSNNFYQVKIEKCSCGLKRDNGSVVPTPYSRRNLVPYKK